ncbi:MAG: glutamine-hydrolyzing carbamoyl-phosphate synthase small subunit [Flavobacteriales bacterium]|nr:glutamine-hydrolyzing carbamoyl-phosphate synthase small subunit [Flavobacteriales bacterium]
MTDKKKAILLLEDGTIFEGKAIGKSGTYSGEIAFNTGMTGYQEIFTDPSYYEQILIMTTSHIGNYGTISKEVESDSIKIAGLIVKKFSDTHSRAGEVTSLNDLLIENKRGGISDIDTRSLVRHVRDKGAMNVIISSELTDLEELKKELAKTPSMDGLELSSKVSTKEPFFMGDESSSSKVAVLDYGVKKNIVRCLTDRGCYVKVFPHNTEASEILAWNPDGIMLSNGPGDPSAMPQEIETVKELAKGDTPMFGICLGHQILALSQGLSTFKMHNGHRGINHPVKNLITGKGEITSQNHGFVVNREEAEAHSDIEMTHVHLNDDTLAGIKFKAKKIFSVQYHPESSPGPNDSRYLFDEFVENIKESKAQLV